MFVLLLSHVHRKTSHFKVDSDDFATLIYKLLRASAPEDGTKFVMNSSSLMASQNILELVASNEPLLNGMIDVSGEPLFVFLSKDCQTRASSDIKFRQQASLKEKFDDGYQKCLLRCSIQDELQPLMSLKSSKEYAQVFYDVVQCHYWGWKYSRILHRDISIGNIMVREKDRLKCGVLNDWDLAIWLNEWKEGSTSKFRIGTKPYMAYEQHSSEWQGPHRFRHDLESVFYVILLLVSLYSSPNEKILLHSTGDHRYEKWHKQDDEYLRGQKVMIIHAGNWQPFPQPFFSGFTLWLITLRDFLFWGFIDLGNHMHAAKRPLKPGRRPRKVPFFDEDTLGGNFSYEKVVMIMHQFNQEELKTWGHEWQATLEEASSEDRELEELEEN
ncbi:hypothetical protein F5876DRAFT_64412 [Lentinula aff. lateritia]|uniref:Uncharacterized protein n=1 Tax=Lentinula aff. lateritia TaxID=2804960 RepID=A0ACC1U491_9AGAR|nr:hypothetical protein F5876DRAFT_64412 [Lentinula aff. lateritia]